LESQVKVRAYKHRLFQPEYMLFLIYSVYPSYLATTLFCIASFQAGGKGKGVFAAAPHCTQGQQTSLKNFHSVLLLTSQDWGIDKTSGFRMS
jgi:hypothetical protein